MLAPAAIPKATSASFSFTVCVESTLRMPARRAISRSRTVTLASASPSQAPPSLSHDSTNEIEPFASLTERPLATPGSFGFATSSAGSDSDAGGELASACSHPPIHAPTASTRVNTLGLVVAQWPDVWLATPTSTMPPTADGSAVSSGPPLSPSHTPVRRSGGSTAHTSLAELKSDASRSHDDAACATVCAHCSTCIGASCSGNVFPHPANTAGVATRGLDASVTAGAVVGVDSCSSATSPISVRRSKHEHTITRVTSDSCRSAAGAAESTLPVVTRYPDASLTTPLSMFSAQCAAVSTRFGATTVPEHCPSSSPRKSRMYAIHGNVPASAACPPMTATRARSRVATRAACATRAARADPEGAGVATAREGSASASAPAATAAAASIAHGRRIQSRWSERSNGAITGPISAAAAGG
jgi:hypothetical protein